MMRRIHILGLVIVLIAGMSAVAYEAPLGYYPGIAALTSGCFPQGVKLESVPLEGVTWPEAQENPLYGVIPFGEGLHAVMIDRYESQDGLYIDADLSGTLEWYPWERTLLDGSHVASIPFEILYEDGKRSPYQAFVIWSMFTPTVVTYCRDSYRAGVIDLGGVSYPLVIFDEDSDGRYDLLEGGTLVLDVDGNGELLLSSDSHEVFSLVEPFNLNGSVYEVAAVAPDGSWIRIVDSTAEVALKPPLLVGYPAPEFTGVDLSGEPFSLQARQGSIVVVDFWASWCGPCIAELPTLRQLADEFPPTDVIVVGVNLDRSESDFVAAVDAHQIGYLQIYDSDTGPIGELYRISGIPMTYVIDREGVIRARGLRGENLITAVRDLIESEEE
jgi:thiol-disulfide isomerase/thioredoxin